MEPKNRFSSLLEHLTTVTAVKHYILAQYLQYDVSYISKWIGGKVLPSEKLAGAISQQISRCIVEEGSQEGLVQLISDYQVQDENELQQAMYDNLIAEYDYVRDLQQNNGTIVAPDVSFYPELALKAFIDKMHHPVLRRVKSLHIMAAIDLFSMAHEHRLHALRIEKGGFVNQHMYPDVHFSLLLNLRDSDENELIYNAMFLNSVLTALTPIDFRLYSSDFAYGKALFVVQNDFAISGMLIRPDACAAVTVCEGADNSAPLYNTIQSLCMREALLFRKITMPELVMGSKVYVHSLLSPNPRWFLGHITEHLLPDDLFEEAIQMAGETAERLGKDTLREIHKLTVAVMKQSQVRVLLYESAITEAMITGNIDFFNFRIQFNFEQRARLLQHLLSVCCSQEGELQVRLIHGQLVADFHNIINPCIFLSSMISYFRLYNSNGNWKLMCINLPEIQSVYDTFFEDVWDGKNCNIVHDISQIDLYINHLLHGVELLSGTRPQETADMDVQA